MRILIILAAGKSSRMVFLDGKHKADIKLLGKSILEHAISKYKNKFDKIVVVKSTPMKNHDNIIYAVQKEPLSTGDAILKAYESIKQEISENDEIYVINSYHIFSEKALKLLESLNSIGVLIQETNEPWKYGIAEIEGGRVIRIIEKPQNVEGKAYRVLGTYKLNKKFIEHHLSKLENSEDVLEKAFSEYAKKNVLGYKHYEEKSLSLKYPWEYYAFFEKLIAQEQTKISKKATIHKSAIIDDSQGPVIIDNGAIIMEQAVIKGPTYIGRGALIGTQAIIRGSNIEAKATIGSKSEIIRSIIQENVKVHGAYIGDSIIDESSTIGYGVVTTNRLLSRETISIEIKGKQINTNKKNIGAFIGRETAIGSNTTLMPGTLTKPKTIIYPNTRIKGIVEGKIKESNF